MNSIQEYPLVSVLLTTYNHEQFITTCLDSVLTQDYPNLEIICGDDASIDRTQDILKAYKDKYPRIIKLSLNKENMGVTKNFNHTLKQCEGEYITLFSGDDIMLPRKITKQLDLFQQDPGCVLCYHNMDVFNSDTGKTLYYYNNGILKPREGNAELLLKYQSFIGAPSVMIRNAAAPSSGFDIRIPNVSDWLFFVEVASKGKIRYIDEVLVRYRRHTNSVTYSARYYGEMLHSLDIIKEKYPDIARYNDRAKGMLYFQQASNSLRNNHMEEFYSLIYRALKYRCRLPISIPITLLGLVRKIGCKRIIDGMMKTILSQYEKRKLINKILNFIAGN